jgi:large subunit ribosomal protein L3
MSGMHGLVGIKLGMTRVFTPEGRSIPVSIVQILDNKITQCKTKDKEGYNALQVTMGTQLPQRVTKPLLGVYSKAGVDPGKGLWELPLSEDADLAAYSLGQSLTIECFQEGHHVDISGTTKGKGFAGVVKRHHFRTQDASHGNSLSHRVPGSIGQNQTPGRVFKGKKMAGHMGSVHRTMQNLKIVRVDAVRKVLFVCGAVPGATGGTVFVHPATKKKSREAS